MDILDELVGLLLEGEIQTREDLQRAKMRLCGEHSIADLPRNSDILARVPETNVEELRPLLVKKPQRTVSGVAVVAAMTKPGACPHGKCIFCPGGVEFGTPQSYTGEEPAAMRAARNLYDPRKQVTDRISQLRRIGHPTDKVDLIVMGGTFTAFDVDYQHDFVKQCFDSLNGRKSESLAEAQTRNESADSRCIGLTIETRPDCFNDDDVERALSFGVTRVELGVQTTDEDVLKSVRRGHGARDSREATKRAKRAGLKVGYHMMPGLPGMTPEDDLACFEEIFTDPDYRPDLLKIYPTAVVAGTELYDMWHRGDFEPYDTHTLVDLIAKIKRVVPPWVRIQRIQRDIPIPLTEAGVRVGHLRELARQALADRGGECSCIRCREVGRLSGDHSLEAAELIKREYEASGSIEAFLSIEENGALFGYARLRRQDDIARLRELRVLGRVVPFDEVPGERWQHKGVGARLLDECRGIAEEWESRTLQVTSGIGARKYYEALGFGRDGPYMAHSI